VWGASCGQLFGVLLAPWGDVGGEPHGGVEGWFDVAVVEGEAEHRPGLEPGRSLDGPLGPGELVAHGRIRQRRQVGSFRVWLPTG
jgi:hypothetical protein